LEKVFPPRPLFKNFQGENIGQKGKGYALFFRIAAASGGAPTPSALSGNARTKVSRAPFSKTFKGKYMCLLVRYSSTWQAYPWGPRPICLQKGSNAWKEQTRAVERVGRGPRACGSYCSKQSRIIPHLPYIFSLKVFEIPKNFFQKVFWRGLGQRPKYKQIPLTGV